MINSIIDGICLALNEEFGNEYEIYTESVKQGLKEPCFSILCINPSQMQFLGKRYYKANSFCIHFFPSSADSNFEINSVRERLFSALEYITVDGDLVRGTHFTAETDESGVLNFIVNYNFFIKKVTNSDPMESYELQHGYIERIIISGDVKIGIGFVNTDFTQIN